MNTAPLSNGNQHRYLRDLLSGVYRSKYFRQHPVASAQMLATLQNSLYGKHRLLKMFFLWGVHSKPGIDERDLKTMDYLSQFLDYLAEALEVSIEMTIVACDTHGALNGVSDSGKEKYSAEIEQQARAHGWDVKRMSSLWWANEITLDKVISEAKKIDVESKAPELVAFAKKYYLGGSAKEGAAHYYTARKLEKTMLEKEFKGYIHVSPIDPALHYLQPQLPDIYIWLAKRGGSAKPWFPQKKVT